jgi:hypothetical protein
MDVRDVLVDRDYCDVCDGLELYWDKCNDFA